MPAVAGNGGCCAWCAYGILYVAASAVRFSADDKLPFAVAVYLRVLRRTGWR